MRRLQYCKRSSKSFYKIEYEYNAIDAVPSIAWFELAAGLLLCGLTIYIMLPKSTEVVPLGSMSYLS